MYVRCKENYIHKVTKRQVLTEGKQYEVISRKMKDTYTLRNDNNKIGVYSRDLFEIVD